MWNKRPYVYKILAFLLVVNIVGITLLINKETVLVVLNRKVTVKNINHLAIDERNDPNETVIFQRIAEEIPNLPIAELNNVHYKNRNLNASCAWYPSFADIQIHNDYWQVFHNTNITYYLFGAYLDKRPTVVFEEPLVRVLTMIHFIAPKDEDYPKTYCQLWFDQQSAPVIVPVKELRKIWYYEWGHGAEHNYGHFVSCALPEEHKNWIPHTVSLVASPCDTATNNVRVIYMPLKHEEVKQGFAVCVKGLDYPYVDMSHRIVEFMETIRSLGAEKVIMYNLQVHPNTTKVLEYYQQLGYLEFLPFSVSLEVGNLHDYRHIGMAKNYFPYILHEVIPYNDCLYRNMYRYKYVAVIDIDEIPMPLGNFSNWHDLMQYGEGITNDNCKNFASFCFRCIYFPRYPEKPRYTEEFPEYFYMLQHVQRVREHIRPEWATKCLHSTDWVIATHNHFPIQWMWNVCSSYSFNATVAQLQHYREPPLKDTLDDPVVDTSLWRFKDVVIERSLRVFNELKFFEEVKKLAHSRPLRLQRLKRKIDISVDFYTKDFTIDILLFK